MWRTRARDFPVVQCLAVIAVAAVVAITGGLAVACSSSGSRRGATGVQSGATTTTSATVTSTSTTVAPPVGGALTPVSTPIQGHAKITAVRAADQGGFDRVTLQFQSGLPGYAVRYIERPVQEDGSGQTVEVAGDNVLQIHMAGATGVDLSDRKSTRLNSSHSS